MRAISRSVQLLLLCNLAFAQPIYDVLARGPEFFIAHRAGLEDLVLLVCRP